MAYTGRLSTGTIVMQAKPISVRGAGRNLARCLDGLPDSMRGAVATLGVFDGMHLGHRKILARTIETAREIAAPAMAITFEPPPKEYFGTQDARLQGWRQRMEMLFDCGLDSVLCLPFDRALSICPERAFATDVLCGRLAVKALVVGDDFRYGHLGEGDVHSLRRHGLRVQAIAAACLDDGRPVSSTAIRKALDGGDLRLAQAMLGRPYSIHGRVSRGQRLGRRLGFPTANLPLGRRQLAPGGVFVVRAAAAGQKFWGVANIGTRPSVASAARPRLEVHLLDCHQDLDLYGQRMSVALRLRLRDEQRFASLARLRAALASDVEQARNLIEKLQ